MVFLKTESQRWRQEWWSWEVDGMLKRTHSCMREWILNCQESVMKLNLFNVAFQMLAESFEERIKIKYVHMVQLNS